MFFQIFVGKAAGTGQFFLRNSDLWELTNLQVSCRSWFWNFNSKVFLKCMIYQFRVDKSKTTRGNSAAISFPQILYESVVQSVFVVSSFSWFIELAVSYMENSFHVIPYLTWNWFEFLIFFYSAFIILKGYLNFPNNLKDIRGHL